MPELPEVQTTVDGINLLAKDQVIGAVWTDLKNKAPMFSKTIKNPTFFKMLESRVVGKKIVQAKRRAKNILIYLQDPKNTKEVEIIHIHLKMTGHMLYGTYVYNAKKNVWLPDANQPALEDPYNRFLHFVISFKNGKQLVLSDVRKFAKVTLIDKNKTTDEEFAELGPEPLDTLFDKKAFFKQINRFPNKPIKTSLMDQRLISGIGNIYSDEILHAAKVLPFYNVKDLKNDQLTTIYKNIVPILSKGIEFGGDSTSDYRNIHGERGRFQGKHAVYRRTGEKCQRKNCRGLVERAVIGARSAHFCRGCQK